MQEQDAGNWRKPLFRRLIVGIALAAVIGSVLGALLRTPAHPRYFLVSPGAAYDTSKMISVEGGQKQTGHLFMLTVNTQPVNLFWQLYAYFDPQSILEPASNFLGGYASYSEYLADSREMMEDSQMAAMAVAEQAAGLPARIERQGAELVEILPDSPTAGLLKKGDIVTRVGDTAIYSGVELRRAITRFAPGDLVPIVVHRGQEVLQLQVPTTKVPDTPERAALRVTYKDARPKFTVPRPVKIDAGNIVGPSAGLMFCLEIVGQVRQQDLTHGMVVAGTGTIDYSGQVGPIGGVEQKVYTAENAHAQVMFVPRGDYSAAKKVATKLQLVPVDTLADAVRWLDAHAGDKR